MFVCFLILYVLPCIYSQDYNATGTVLASKPPFDQVLAMGKVEETLWIIPPGSRVYKVDASKFDAKQGRLPLTNAQMTTLEQSCSQWANQPVNRAIVLQNFTGIYLLYNTQDPKYVRMCDVLSSSESIMSIPPKATSKQQVWISSCDVMVFYLVERRKSSITIAKVAPMVRIKDDDRNLTEMAPFTFAYFICPVDPQKLTDTTIYLSPQRCRRAVNWKVVSGYACHKRFYLFSSQNEVYIFDKILFNEADPLTIGSYEVRNYSEFFGNPPIPAGLTSTTDTAYTLPLLPLASVTLAILIFIIVMLVLWLCVFKQHRRNLQTNAELKETHQPKKSKSGKQSPKTKTKSKPKRAFDTKMLPNVIPSNLSSLKTNANEKSTGKAESK